MKEKVGMSDLAQREGGFDFGTLDQSRDWIDSYWQKGYAIIKDVFGKEEIDRFAARFDRWYAEGMRHPSTFRHLNKVIWIEHAEPVGRFVRGMQWPSYEDEVLDSVRTDTRMLSILEPLIGNNLKQIINQLHWKTPGSRITWGLHRDVRSRKPSEAFRDLAKSYVQTGLAIDRHWAGNGAMKILPGSHLRGRMDLDTHGGGRWDTGEKSWREAGVDLEGLIDLEMEPGDVALWSPFTLHGGGINETTDNYRRLYINGYVIAENCDRGEPVFRQGKPVLLDLLNPALIQFEEIATRREAHYVGDKPSD